ncbi:MAG: 2-oxoacid:acceptor oxidoreductase family protein [Bdellovibrionota bacterium]|jgi:indolepyruvate ferredoxin oxidoreductase beta subunit
MSKKSTDIVIAGLGGQGVLTCANIVAYAAFLAGFDVKESEVHGMSQRGGSVSSDIRFGEKIFSPMISSGEADFLILLSDTEEARSLHYLRPKSGVVLYSSKIDVKALPLPAVLNTVLLGSLSKLLEGEQNIPTQCWEEAITKHVPATFIKENLEAFKLGLLQ